MAEGQKKRQRRSMRERLSAISEAMILRTVFYGLVGIAIYVLVQDYKDLTEQSASIETMYTTRQPVPLVRPETGDHIRPYLPFTRPEDDGDGKKKHGRLPFLVPKEVESGPMRFVRGPRGTARAMGRIVPGTADSLKAFLDAQEGEVKTLVLHSPGGSVRDAIAMARLIREAKLTTEVPDNAYCASSCPLVFAGGEKRVAGRKSWIGVHQVYAGNNVRGTLERGMAEAQVISARCQEALLAFGISPKVWIHAMQTPKDQLYFLTPKQMTEYKLATKIETTKKGSGSAHLESRAK